MEWIQIFPDSTRARQVLVPGKPMTITAGNRRLCVALINDRLVAISDKCPHNGESLGKGRLNHLGEVICPWHGYRFNMVTGRCSEPCADAETFPVREGADGVFVAV